MTLIVSLLADLAPVTAYEILLESIHARTSQSLAEYPPRQGADSLSMKKAIEDAMKQMEAPNNSSN
jgi:hypothetical protein